jgi:hypothetical protein
LKPSQRGLTNEERKILPSKKGGAGGVLARTIGRALLNLYPSLVAGWRGLLCRHFGGVRIMNCDYCGQVMREGTHYWGEYCQTKNCFNSELARLIYGARIKREKASK